MLYDAKSAIKIIATKFVTLMIFLPSPFPNNTLLFVILVINKYPPISVIAAIIVVNISKIIYKLIRFS